MQLIAAVIGTAGSTVPFTPGSVATHASGDRLTLYVMGKETTLTTPDTPTATNGWELVKSFLDDTTDLFMYTFAIQATSSSMAAPQIAFPGSTPTVTGWAMSSHRVTSGRFWKDPIGYAGNDTTTFGDYIHAAISTAAGGQYSYDNYPLPTDWFSNLTSVFGVGAVPTDASAALDPIQTLFQLYNADGGTTLRTGTQYAESSAGGGLAVVWYARQGYTGDPMVNNNTNFGLSPVTSEDALIGGAVMREDTVAPPGAPLLPATGSGSLSLSGTGTAGVPSEAASGSASLSLSAAGAAGEPSTSPGGWTDPLLLTNPDPFNDGNDCSSLPSLDLCWVGGDLVVVAAFSYDSYALRLWAIDVSGDEPDVGPMAVVNTNEDYVSWMTDPLPVDPQDQAIGNFQRLICLDTNNFAMIGEAESVYHSDGTVDLDFEDHYAHLASFFHVDPGTKEITRTAFCVVDYDLLENGWVEGLNACAWDDKLFLTSDSSPEMLVAHPDGTVDIHTHSSTWFNFNSPVVIGDTAYFMGYPPYPYVAADHKVASWDLVGAVFSEGPALVGSGDDDWSWFSAKTSTDQAAFIFTASWFNSRYSDITLSYVDPDTSIGDTPEMVFTPAMATGWTGGWFGNVRTITPRSGGSNMLVGYVNSDDRLLYSIEVGPAHALTEPMVAPFNNPGFLVQSAQLIDAGPDRLAAVYVRQTSGTEEGYTYGANFAMWRTPATTPEVVDLGFVAKSHFWGQ